jgi:very-short-patch-repair endonuclease
MAAVLECGPRARLSHRSAAALWGIRARSSGPIDVVVPADCARRRPGVRVHRQVRLTEARRWVIDGIPVGDPVSTVVDLASVLSPKQLEAAVNEAAQLDLVNPEELCAALNSQPRRPGIGRLRRLLDRETFVMTETELERRFLRIVRRTSLPLPETQVRLNGYRVDFYWRDQGLVVEADSLRYHRTAHKQAADRRRDHAHLGAGLTTLRFSHSQIRYEPGYVMRILVHNFERLQRRG